MPSITKKEASQIIDIHEFHGIDELWAHYEHLTTLKQVHALYELAWATLEDPNAI